MCDVALYLIQRKSAKYKLWLQQSPTSEAPNIESGFVEPRSHQRIYALWCSSKWNLALNNQGLIFEQPRSHHSKMCHR